MPTVRVQEDPKYGLTHQVGSITLEHGVKGEELERELNSAREEFIRAMAARGMILYDMPGNPKWIVEPTGEYAAWYAIDWEGKRSRKEVRTGGNVVELPKVREGSLEDSEGEVEYRIVGIFWTPERSIEILVHKQQIKDEERAAKSPMIFGQGSAAGGSPMAAPRPEEYE